VTSDDVAKIIKLGVGDLRFPITPCERTRKELKVSVEDGPPLEKVIEQRRLMRISDGANEKNDTSKGG
jgi:hypothetical protein